VRKGTLSDSWTTLPVNRNRLRGESAAGLSFYDDYVTLYMIQTAAFEGFSIFVIAGMRLRLRGFFGPAEVERHPRHGTKWGELYTKGELPTWGELWILLLRLRNAYLLLPELWASSACFGGGVIQDRTASCFRAQLLAVLAGDASVSRAFAPSQGLRPGVGQGLAGVNALACHQ